MKTSMDLYFSTKLDAKTKLDIIKKSGYDEFFTIASDKNETLSVCEQIGYAKKLGLGCTMIHCVYYEPFLNHFWEDDEHGEVVMNDFISQINSFGKFCDNFVVHLNGSKDANVSEIGLKRIKQLLSVCEKYNVNLCIENLYNKKEIPYIFSNITHPLLKICYDCGHRNFLTPDFDVCKDYGKYITVVHLHENNGERDEHKPIQINSKVYNRLVEDLKYINPNVSLATEVKFINENQEEFLISNHKIMKSLM